METQTYNGFAIKYDEGVEEWYASVDENGKPAEYESRENRVSNKSLKKLKENLDIIRRKKFERMAVFVRASHRRGYYRGDDPGYEPQYIEATLTSISPAGFAFTVEKGRKTADKTRLYGYGGRTGIIADTPKNRKLIEQIEAAGREEYEAKKKQDKLGDKLEQIDGPKLYKKVYGKDLG